MNSYSKLSTPIIYLKKAYKKNRLAHFYIFNGDIHSEKKKCALWFAKLILCKNVLPEIEPCKKCESCKMLENSNLIHPDLYILKVEQEHKGIRIEDIAELQKIAAQSPFISKWQVFIIEDAHLFLETAANRILKLIEEPEKNKIFIFLTLSTENLLKTILSRAQILNFPSIYPNNNYLEIEDKKVPPYVLKILSNISLEDINQEIIDIIKEIDELFLTKDKNMDIEISEILNKYIMKESNFSKKAKKLETVIYVLWYWIKFKLKETENLFIKSSLLEYIEDIKRNISVEFIIEELSQKLSLLKK